MEKANVTSTVVLFHISYFNVTLSLLIDADAVTLVAVLAVFGPRATAVRSETFSSV
jgi:hypothetical protein